MSQIFITLNTCFFFKRNHDSPENEYYVLTLEGDSPFRITEEGLGSNIVGSLVTIENAKVRESTKHRTFKVWNTPFAIESFRGLAIPKEEYGEMEKLQYIIYTNDAWIQFVTFDPVKWTFHQDIKLDELVIQYLRKDYLDD
ncbi:MAG TPA: hypothetical protein VNJ08_12910 [Bacteriovoracaceae bacterium]|nr:hypothetical protein [Bacteriovoracaceae bacterium]